jgi:hypothetical protein
MSRRNDPGVAHHRSHSRRDKFIINVNISVSTFVYYRMFLAFLRVPSAKCDRGPS